jgi:hypothetical protein
MYDYKEHKHHVFTDEGQRMFMDIYRKSVEQLKFSGAFRLGNVISGVSGSTWDMIACVDRMVELGLIQEVTKDCSAQARVFVATQKTA